MTRIILRYPNNDIKEVDFEQPRLRIGTAPDNDLVVENEDVEEHQAEIETRDGAFTLKDLSENKSTTVNGKTFETIGISYGDRIAFGPVIGLFYPPQKKRMGERGKLLMFMAAGASVLIVAIALIFFFISRPDYTDATTGAAFVDGTEQEELATERPDVEETVQGLTDVQEINEQGLQSGTASEGRDEGVRRGFLHSLRIRREKLALLEPPFEDIQKRQAVAIPRGFGRLFFRKQPVTGIPVEAVGTELLSPDAEGQELPATTPEAGTVVETVPEVTEGLGQQTEVVDVGEFTEDRGFPSLLLTPFRRLVNLIVGEEAAEVEVIGESSEIPLIPTESATPETTAPVVEFPAEVEETAAQVTLELEDVQVTGAELGEEARSTPAEPYSFEETPVYSAEELAQAHTGIPWSAYALSESETINSKALWSYSLPTEVAVPIIVRSGMVGLINDDRYQDFVFGTALNELVALDGERGDEIFREDLGAPFIEPLLKDVNGDGDDDIIVVFENGAITAFSYSDTLDRIWQFSGRVPITVPPALVDVNGDRTDDIVLATLDMDVITLDGRTGFEIWRFFDAETDIAHAPVAVELNDDGVEDILFSTRRGFLYAIDGSNGWGLWKSPLTGMLAGPPSLGDLDGDGDVDIVTLTRGGTLSAYSRLGRLLFTEETEGRYSVAPSVGDTDGDGEEEILYIDNEGILSVVEGATRRELWRVTSAEGPVNGRIVINDLNDDGIMEVLLPTLSGALLVLNGESGDQEALFNSSGRVWATPLVSDLNQSLFHRKRIKSILLCTENGMVYAIQVQDWEGRLFSFGKTSWVSTHHDIRNTGYAHSGLSILPWK
jgi:outer membrane protein assembly factor BamB